MDWAAGGEPPTGAVTSEYLRSQDEAWSNGGEYSYAMTGPGSGEVIGMCSLMRRVGEGALEIGYWVRTDMTGRGVATEAAKLLTNAALALSGIERVEIHHDAANIASARVPEKLGYTELRRDDAEIDNPGESGVSVVWEFTGSTPT